MKKNALILIPIFLFILGGIESCKSNKKSDDQKMINAEEIEEITQEIELAVYPLPTSAEVIRMLTELETGYIIGISNPVDNAKNYLTTNKKAINMGIYGADLSYATLFNMNQEVINYLDAIRGLANDLKMSKIYNQKIYNDLKDNADDREELVDILTGSFNDTYDFLRSKDQQVQALLIVGGAWIEGMYITTNISEAVYHVQGIVDVLLEQKRSYELYIELVQPHADDPAIKEILELFAPLSKVYEGIESSLSEKNVEDITSTVESIRDKIIL